MRKMEVIVYRDREKKVNGFQVSGHSGYGEAGNDILCSAVSALTINCVNSIETLTHDRPSIQAVNEEEGFLHYRLET
ncbi:MAG: ribosomal-processing cysteine protease Prp, partial [Lachnospiraceae bacterium]|nr:ribosomal-processing cysteine protease Prp [Lachnospiraceae bacterium]